MTKAKPISRLHGGLSPWQTGALAHHARRREALSAGRALSGVDQAVHEAGGVTLLAEMLGVSYQCVQHWRKAGYVPERYVIEIEAMLGVPRKALVNPRLRDLLDSGLGED